MQSRNGIYSNSSKEQSLFSYCPKFITPVIDLDPYYFSKYSEYCFLFLDIPIKAGSKLIVGNTEFDQGLLLCRDLVYNKEVVGYLLVSTSLVQYSGSYVINKAAKLTNSKEVEATYKLGFLVVYDLGNAFVAVSAKMSSMTQSILEEQ